jgi:hypothetical protein
MFERSFIGVLFYSKIPLPRRRRNKSGHDKKSLCQEPDKDFTTSRYFQSLENEAPDDNTHSTSPDVFSDSDGVTAYNNTGTFCNRNRPFFQIFNILYS